MRTKDLRECDINELYDFIVGSNLEHSFVEGCSKESKPIFKEWFQID